ncbi:hypothetical protein [Halobacteriovorax sp. GB3]|uniref:hypothetical protein n=1 Tax=Halobacteriovorax sp. GB3 TaxID=2719615 RepID=UPI002361260F|nr:hypothetical protein [Halobacteriovorax sp. GB3]
MMDKRLITGIGSLNFNTVEESIHFTTKFDIPFLPQLPHLEGNMIDQMNSLTSLSLIEFSKIEAQKVKIQIPGPISSDLNIDAIKEYFLFLYRTLKHKELIIFVDEPYLPEINQELEELISFIRQFGECGLHSCSKRIVDLKKLNLDYYSFDASLEERLDYGQAKTLVIGIIPTDKKYDIEKLKKIKLDDRRVLLSPACGLADKGLDSYQILKDLLYLKANI